jgi:hypothetical protein
MISFSIFFHHFYSRPRIVRYPEWKEVLIQWLIFEIDIDWYYWKPK